MGRVQTKIQSYCWNEFLGLKHRMIVDKINRGKGKTRGRFCDVSIESKTIKHCNTLYIVLSPTILITFLSLTEM